MDDIFTACREGNAKFVRQFLENIENDLNEGDDHGFTPLHWACREGQMVIYQMLIARGARVSARNDGGDTPLHLACSHGNKVGYIILCVLPPLTKDSNQILA